MFASAGVRLQLPLREAGFHVEHGPAGMDVSRETQAKLARFVALLLHWNATVNLVARADEPFLWDRHIADSLQLAPLMTPRTERAIDFGSGAGFPGLILALATGVPFDLIEADQRKAAFLREAARVTGAPVRIHAVRIEAASMLPAPLITARAVAALPRLLMLAAPLLAPGGMCLFLKGGNANAELTHAATQWQMQADGIPSRTAPGARILRITGIGRVPRSV
jgi:16S rRNA (guanine527-N7)-methyltransferase